VGALAQEVAAFFLFDPGVLLDPNWESGALPYGFSRISCCAGGSGLACSCCGAWFCDGLSAWTCDCACFCLVLGQMRQAQQVAALDAPRWASPLGLVALTAASGAGAGGCKVLGGSTGLPLAVVCRRLSAAVAGSLGGGAVAVPSPSLFPPAEGSPAAGAGTPPWKRLAGAPRRCSSSRTSASRSRTLSAAQGTKPGAFDPAATRANKRGNAVQRPHAQGAAWPHIP